MIQIKRNMKLYCLDTSINNYEFNSREKKFIIKQINKQTNRLTNGETKQQIVVFAIQSTQLIMTLLS